MICVSWNSISTLQAILCRSITCLHQKNTEKCKWRTDTTYDIWLVNTQFNDIFSFFLSGEGIEGPYDAPPEFPGQAVNIASLPNSNPALPITISSVNDEINSEYYVGVPPDLRKFLHQWSHHCFDRGVSGGVW